MSLSSARSITAAVNPPRAVFLDFPLGRTAGKPGDQDLQRRIMRDALAAIVEIDQPGTIRDLPHRWSETDAWKDRAMRPTAGSGGTAADDRVARDDTPQYQYPEDAAAARGAAD